MIKYYCHDCGEWKSQTTPRAPLSFPIHSLLLRDDMMQRLDVCAAQPVHVHVFQITIFVFCWLSSLKE